MHELWNQVSEEWHGNSPETYQNLIQDIARKIQAVFRAKGSHTEYQIVIHTQKKCPNDWPFCLAHYLISFDPNHVTQGLLESQDVIVFLHKQVMLPDYIRRSHQSDLLKTSKHWDIFLSHCT